MQIAGENYARSRAVVGACCALLTAVTTLLTGCSGPAGSDRQTAAGRPRSSSPTPIGPIATTRSTAATTSRPSSVTTRAAPSSGRAATALPTAASTAISIPPNLCAATGSAQNTADAYMGALSAGDEKQALDCVLPGAVPKAVTRGLVSHVKGTAAYLPRNGVDGPTVFGYAGNGKTIDVTVTRAADGKTWVTKVAVR